MFNLKYIQVKQLAFIIVFVLIDFLNSFAQKKELFTDPRDGHVYKTVRIGNQIWLAENLAYLPSVNRPKETGSVPGYYVYGYTGKDINEAKKSENYKSFGVLYNYKAAKNACPKGWHLPTDEEWEQLTQYVSGVKYPSYDRRQGADYYEKANSLKSTDWHSGSSYNTTGFSALPAGFYINKDKFFYYADKFGGWWSATEKDDANAFARVIVAENKVFKKEYDKSFGFSVRCIKDNNDTGGLKSIGKPTIECVSISAGTFIMGSPEREDGRMDKFETQHKVTLSAFKMSKYEITFEQYDAFCDATGSKKPDDEGWGRGNRPVINVSWDDAVAFAEWIGGRLPTEAEWEYACRAGTTTTFYTGDCLSISQANFSNMTNYNHGRCDNERSESRRTKPVGSYSPNPWGLYDMHGNVREWCFDKWGEYSTSSQTNPKGAVTSRTSRAVRDGAYTNGPYSCRSASRISMSTTSRDSRNNYTGFRIVFEGN